MKTILVAEDESDIRDIISQMLSKDGHQVICADSGKTALEKLGDSKIDLIVTDILMPKMDGIDFAMEVRERFPDMRIIAISGGRRGISAQFNLNSAEMIGVDAILKKPFDRTSLLNTVNRFL